jgi:hypothetical protein
MSINQPNVQTCQQALNRATDERKWQRREMLVGCPDRWSDGTTRRGSGKRPGARGGARTRVRLSWPSLGADGEEPTGPLLLLPSWGRPIYTSLPPMRRAAFIQIPIQMGR